MINFHKLSKGYLDTKKGVLAMEFLKQLLFSSVEFVIIGAVMVAGVLIGKKLRESKDNKAQNTEE